MPGKDVVRLLLNSLREPWLYKYPFKLILLSWKLPDIILGVLLLALSINPNKLLVEQNMSSYPFPFQEKICWTALLWKELWINISLELSLEISKVETLTGQYVQYSPRVCKFLS